MPPKETPLVAEHRALKGRLVDFHGWLLPIQYEGVLAEHATVRTACGIFDVSHMGEIIVRGTQALEFLQHIAINDLSKIKPGRCQYTAILNEQGGIIDDLIIYRLGEREFFICVNGANVDRDAAWFQSVASKFDVEVENASSKYAQIAVQGPKSPQVLAKYFESDKQATEFLKSLKFGDIKDFPFKGRKLLVARTGYTGELGYEIYLANEGAASLWRGLLEAGAMPCGLGARDTLRLEATYLLHGSDMNETTSPLEVGLDWITKLDKPAFVGKDILSKQKSAGVKRNLLAFKLTEQAIARAGMDLYSADGQKLIGKVTSGSVLPTVGGAGGLAFVDANCKEGDKLLVDVRGKRKEAQFVKKPFYQAKIHDNPWS